MNKVFIIGNVCNDIELQTTQNGINYCRFSIGVSRRVAKDAEKVSDFIQIVAWRKTAELSSLYLQKGNKVAVSGRIQTGSYEKDGVKHYTTDVVADEVEFLTPKSYNNNLHQTKQPSRPAHISEMEPLNEDLPF